MIKAYLGRRSAKKEEASNKDLSPWHSQSHLQTFPTMGLFPEYLEMSALLLAESSVI